MKFRVQPTWGGGDSYAFRITGPDGDRVAIHRGEGEDWNRNAASRAKDLICRAWNVDRAAIRFEHR